MPPEIIDRMTQFRVQLDAQDAAQSLRMANAWLEITRGLDGEMERLAMEIAREAAAGRPMRQWHIARMQRYQSLMRQVGEQVATFQPMAAAEVTEAQALMARWALDHSQQLIAMQQGGITGQFDRLPVSAVQNMVGIAGDGSPLNQLVRASFADAAPDVMTPLVRGVALGWHPTRTARAMRDAVNITLDRAITLARTETARVYREASRQQYIRSGVVESYVRIASKSARTCMACLLADGSEYPLSVPFEEHINGRCVAAPKLTNVPFPVFETGEEWFERQDEATQRRMMGPGRFEAWQQGRFALPDLVTVHHNDTWGNSLQVTPLRVLQGRPVGSVARTTMTPIQPSPPVVSVTYQPSTQQAALVDQHVMDQISRYANRHGMPVADVQITVMQTLRDLITHAPLARKDSATVLPLIRQSGRIKSQFETGTSGGALTIPRRSDAEFKGLGYPRNVADYERPIYGYLDLNPGDDAAWWYGSNGTVQFVFKEEVRERTTFTVGDSLGKLLNDKVYGSPINAPRIGSSDTAIDAIMEYARTGDIDDLLNSIELGYVEIQIQGGVQLGDIDYVLDLDNKVTSAERKLWRDLGIMVH